MISREIIFQIFFSGNNITPPPRGRKRKNLASMPIPSPPVMQMMEEDDQNEEIVLDGIDPTTAAMPANVQNRYFMSFFFELKNPFRFRQNKNRQIAMYIRVEK